ncbi:hypothetical protein MHU86_18732 [Fragilaria crotonensis]|nr:hypothetical protein MHU86_18732 [Fragilaria crotonensis]
MARYVCTIHMFTEDEEPIKASYSLGTIQDDVDEIIRATGNMYLMSVQNTLTMIAHALVRHTTRCQAPQYSLLSNIPKFERIRSDRSRETTVQSSKSHFGTLVGADNSADSRLKTMTSDENSDNGSATPHFCADFSTIKPAIPDSPKIPTATSPTFYELYPEYSPCSFPESDPEPTRNDNSTTLDSVSKFSTSSPIPDVVLEISDSVKRSVNGSNASLSYCAAVDTGNAATVVRTAVSSPNPQQWACRAHNPTVSSETLTYLDVQHPVPIKLEDLPSSQADDADVFLADHYPLPEVANDPDPEPMDIVEDDLDNNGDANRDIGEPNEVPSAAIQQLVRLLPPLRPAPPFDPPTPRRHSSPPFSDVPTLPSHSVTRPVFHRGNANGHNQRHDSPSRPTALRSHKCNYICLLHQHTRRPTRTQHHPWPRQALHPPHPTHVIRNHMYIDELISGTNIPLLNVRPDKLLLLRSMKHTLNRATNMVVQHLNEQQRSQFLPRRTPRAFSDIDDAFHDDPPDCPMETRCAVAIIYALRLLYITHHRNYFNRDHGLAEHYFYPDHLFAIAKEIKSTAAALSLLPDTTTFNLLPCFVHDAFDEVDDLFPEHPLATVLINIIATNCPISKRNSNSCNLM